MALPMTENRYLLPGESYEPLVKVIHHGTCKKESSKPSDFFSILPTYKPKMNDFVIGIVLARTANSFVVDINTTEPAILPTGSFDLGCLPPRQNMDRTSAVYAVVKSADPFSQTELSCRRSDGCGKQNDFGLLDYGYMIRCSLKLLRKLKESEVIRRLGGVVEGFDIRIAENGFIWYTADKNKSIIGVKNVIYEREVENDCERLIELYKRIIAKLEKDDVHSLIQNN